MTVEVLIMCSTCGRPQPPRVTCIQCGADLPESPVPTAPAAARAIPPVEVRTEFDLGDGRKLVITGDALELVGSSHPQTNIATRPVPNVMGTTAPSRVPLASVRRAGLSRLRTWPALVVGVLSLGILVVSPWWFTKVPALVGVAAAVWFFVRTRYFVVRFERSEGTPANLVLGGGAAGSRRGVHAQSVWLELSSELRRRGIRVDAS